MTMEMLKSAAASEQGANTIFGVDLSNPYEVASFLLTQMHIKSGVNCLMGQAHIPVSNASNVNHAVIDWDKTIKILNDALRAASSHAGEDGVSVMLPKSYDYHLQIVGDDLQDRCFFLNDNVCNFKTPGRNLSSLPRQPMLIWIKEQNNNMQAPQINPDSMEDILRSIKGHAERAREGGINDNGRHR